jgi:hypothetical protein
LSLASLGIELWAIECARVEFLIQVGADTPIEDLMIFRINRLRQAREPGADQGITQNSIIIICIPESKQVIFVYDSFKQSICPVSMVFFARQGFVASGVL